MASMMAAVVVDQAEALRLSPATTRLRATVQENPDKPATSTALVLPQATGVDQLWTPQQQQQQQQRSSSPPVGRAAAPPASRQEWKSWVKKLMPIDETITSTWFGKQLSFFIKGFNRERQLYVSSVRGTAKLQDLELDAAKINVIFNPFAGDQGLPLQLVAIDCKRVSIDWKSIFSLRSEPLQVAIPRLELVLDASADPPSRVEAQRIQSEWNFAAGAAAATRPTNYPPVEGARYVVDEVVCFIRRLETALPGCRNATVRIVLRNLEAVSVDRNGRAQNLKVCWNSFNSVAAIRDRSNGDQRRPLLIIAKRLVASDVEVLLAPTDPGPTNATFITRLVDTPRAAALLTLGYDGWHVANLRFDIRCDTLDIEVPEPALVDYSARQTPGQLPEKFVNTGPQTNVSVHFQFGGPNGTLAPSDKADGLYLLDEVAEPAGFGAAVGAALVKFNNAVLRPTLALTIFLWSFRLI